MLENLTASDNEFVRALALFMPFILVAVVRPRHLQMSVISLGARVEAYVEKGKRRIRGQQAPFHWAASRLGFLGLSWANL